MTTPKIIAAVKRSGEWLLLTDCKFGDREYRSQETADEILANYGKRAEWPDGYGPAVLHDLPTTPEPLPPLVVNCMDAGWVLPGPHYRPPLATVRFDFSEAGKAELAERIAKALHRVSSNVPADLAASIAAEVVGCNVVIERRHA